MKMQRFRQLDYQLESRCETLQLAAQQDERKRIAQELHDTLLQGFTGIAAMMGSIITWYRIALTPAHVLRTIRAHLDLAGIFICQLVLLSGRELNVALRGGIPG